MGVDISDQWKVNKRNLGRLIGIGALALAVGGCTEARLVSMPLPPPPPIDNFLRVTGSFCTQDPADVEFPVKILFVVDTSRSMSLTDPPNPADANFTGRGRAMTDVVNALAGQRGVEIGIITFSGAVNNLTSGFRPNETIDEVAFLLQAAANSGSEAFSATNYEVAVDAAYQLLLDDMLATNETARSRSKYVVIFLSDGLPNPIEFDPPANTPELVLSIVEDIRDLERLQRLQELKFHTVYLAGITPPVFQIEPINLLKEMSETGAGTFRNVQNGEKINFLDIGFTSFRRTFTLKSFLAQNLNARPHVDIYEMTDSDGDGLTDMTEELVGTYSSLLDTDGDGFNDLLENRMANAGFDPLDGSDGDCVVVPNDDYNRRDDDGDGLLNCEERFLGTNQRLIDTDADGIPDSFEVREQMSAVDNDYFGDLDRDGIANGFELRDRTNPRLDDRDDFTTLRYFYDLKEVEIRESQICYEFEVDNIQLVPAQAPDGEEGGWNDVYFVIGEAPVDDPEDFGEFRAACVRAQYLIETDQKRPASGTIELFESNFRKTSNPNDPYDPEVFTPDRDCVRP